MAFLVSAVVGAFMGGDSAKTEKYKYKQKVEERRKAEEERKMAELKQKTAKEWQDALPNIQKSIDDTTDDIKEYKQQIGDAETAINTAKTQYLTEKNNSAERMRTQIADRDALFKTFQENQTKISDAINKTNVDESNIPQFLDLINDGLIGSTLTDTVKRDALTVTIKTFGEIMDRFTSTVLSLDAVLEGKLAAFIEPLNKEDYTEMQDLLCDNDEEFQEIIGIIERGQGEPLKKIMIKRMKKVCMREYAQDTWMEDESEKQDIKKQALQMLSPPLVNFWGAIDVAMTDARKYLEYGADYTDDQTAAIKAAPQNEETLKAIAEKEEKEEKKSEEPDTDTDVDNTKALTESSDKALAKAAESNDGLKKIKEDNTALLNAALVKLHVVESMKDQFVSDDYPDTLDSGLTVVTDVESCCLQIMQSQATIRSSVLIARAIIEFKPAKPSDDAAPLWSAIDNGIVNIFTNYIEMSKVSVQYFSYFLKFKIAFQHFLSCYEINPNVRLRVAMEYVKRDVKNFTKFSSKMEKTMNALTEQATSVISDCMAKTAGADAFKKAEEERQKAKTAYLLKQKHVHDQQVLEDAKVSAKREVMERAQITKAKAEIDLESATIELKSDQDFLEEAKKKAVAT